MTIIIVAIVITILILPIVQILRIRIMVNRLTKNVEFAMLLQNVLFNGDICFEEYKDKEFGVDIGNYNFYSSNFKEAVVYLKKFTKKNLEIHEEIVSLTDYYDLSEHEKILNDILNTTGIWIWQHKEETDK